MSPTERMTKIIKSQRSWLKVGLGIKRWILMLGIGSAVLGMGLVYGLIWLRRIGVVQSRTVYLWLTLQWLPPWVAMVSGLLLGGVMVIFAMRQLGRNVTAPFRPDTGESLVDLIFAYQMRNQGPKIVAIGGGTGLSNLLRGLSAYTRNITAIVTVADDGGSSGRLRRELGILPPGDFRNNLAALSRDEALMTRLLQYRFGGSGESNLSGHAFGNLLIAALVGLTGSFEEALLAAQRVLAIRGRVLPSTLTPVTLEADVRINNRLTRVSGESQIPRSEGQIERVFLSPEEVRGYPEAIQAILKADLVVLGPGSLYTSILPNLLVPDIANALQHSRALKVYVCNVATQPGETDQYSVADHVAHLTHHISAACFDLVLANNQFIQNTEQTVTFVTLENPQKHAMILENLINEEKPSRHDPKKLAAALVDLLR
ncbi:MAG: uridine diphosphate-N-acetylglucosamine-binding protein YvcK [Ardenticatenaceae bacterium]|nr:uridine diphosphate-N-acetylglucosamine-binding protein YvcK [Ardenticatenaceae bacterium]